MKVVVVVLARLGSRRLPGKALRSVAGKPMIEYVFDACPFDEADEVVLATTDQKLDDSLARWATGRGYSVFRGDETDVAGRFLGAIDAHGADAALRVNGDSPLHRREMLARAVRCWRDGPVDLLTNLPKRTWPFGLSIEIVSRDAMMRAVATMTSASHREHVTSVFYEQPSAFNIRVLPEGAAEIQGTRLTVDEAEDLERFEYIVQALGEGFHSADVFDLVRHARAFADSDQL